MPIISAIAFATVLGTVSGLIVAASGAVAHDLIDRFFKIKMDDRQKVRAGKISAFVIGGIAIVLGILFKGMNVTFLVGLAFAVAASANLPAIIMLLFWKSTTAKGIAASIVVGIVVSLALIAFSPELYTLYGRNPLDAPIPLNNPGIISIPLSFITLVVVSLLTQRRRLKRAEPVGRHGQRGHRTSFSRVVCVSSAIYGSQLPAGDDGSVIPIAPSPDPFPASAGKRILKLGCFGRIRRPKHPSKGTSLCAAAGRVRAGAMQVTDLADSCQRMRSPVYQ